MSAARGNAISTRLRAVTVAERFGYSVRFAPVAEEDDNLGAPVAGQVVLKVQRPRTTGALILLRAVHVYPQVVQRRGRWLGNRPDGRHDLTEDRPAHVLVLVATGADLAEPKSFKVIPDVRGVGSVVAVQAKPNNDPVFHDRGLLGGGFYAMLVTDTRPDIGQSFDMRVNQVGTFAATARFSHS